MATSERKAARGEQSAEASFWRRTPAYEEWISTLGVPIHRGYYVEDLRTVGVAWWEERQCNAAFMLLAGQEGVSEVRLTEILPGKSVAPVRMSLDEVVYVVDGRGLATVWAEGKPEKSFEWQKHSLFLIPRSYYCRLSNVQGSKTARLVHYNSLPLAMSINPDPALFFDNNSYANLDLVYGADGGFYSEAKVVQQTPGSGGARPNASRLFWLGNFFPDMRAWDKIIPYRGRGAGGHAVWIRSPSSPLWNHMSVFPSRTYKKAHRHGPGTLIVIPAGEGYSFMWPEGKEKVLVPWHEASVFVPPNRWFHQHFNVGAAPARYLAFHGPRGSAGNTEWVQDLARDQIEYPDEDPIIRKTFEGELAKRGLKSLMPEPAYKERSFEWEYAGE
jgi:hypothetical protein